MEKKIHPSKAVIIAAGTGSRIKEKTNDTPKTLLPFGNKSILSVILNNISNSGINNFGIVVGYKSELIEDYLKRNNYFGYNIAFIQNREWNRGNGISVLLAEEYAAGQDFILSMSDHIVSTSAIKRIVNYKNRSNLLLVDSQINNVYDIDDATKVKLNGNRIINIGKEIKDYNGIDCGIFRLNNNFFSAMRSQLEKGQESISAAITILIKKHNMSAVFTEAEDYWIDIDTAQAYKHAFELFAGK